MRRRKQTKMLFFTLLIMAIGAAAVTTSLVLNGTLNIMGDTTFDGDVVFVSAKAKEGGSATISNDGKSITYTSKELSKVSDASTLNFEIANKNRQYDAVATINCNTTVSELGEYVRIEPNATEYAIEAGGTTSGNITSTLIKAYTGEDAEVTFTCNIVATASERETIGEEYIELKTYGVKRKITSSSPSWERIEDGKGLIANATHDGNSTQNDFDSLYPWSSIISYNYDTETQSITAYYGDDDFKFDGSNGEVLTRIPEFWYKREQSDGWEYVYISNKEREGFIKSEQFSVGRYTTSGNNKKIYSRSGVKPLVSTTITNFRTYSRALGDDFGQLDYRYFVLQLLYLVEYANYNSQDMLGYGNVRNSGPVLSGGCDILGMKSGSLINDKKHSVIYRGVEDIFGNIFQYVDGINLKDYQIHINYNPKTYQSDIFVGDYKAIGYTIATISTGYVSKLGYDALDPLIAFSIAAGGTYTTYITDYSSQSSGNRIVRVGGNWNDDNKCGLYFFATNSASSLVDMAVGSRLLRNQ